MDSSAERMYLTDNEEKQINIRFHTGNEVNTDMNYFLSRVMRKIRSERKPIPSDNVYSLFNAEHFSQLWIQTVICKYSRMGQCTVCNYWEGHDQAEVIDKVIAECCLPKNCETLLINTCGSCMDPYEISVNEQTRLFEWIKVQPCRKVILETHLNTLNNESIRRVRELLCNKELYFEVGIESLSKQILFYSLNKVIPFDRLEEIINCIHSVGAFCIANVLLGAPFMTPEEQVYDVSNSITLLLEKSIDYVVVFPVNVKPHTLAAKLNTLGEYKIVSGNMIISVLTQLPKELLGRIDISWYGEHVEENVIKPVMCPKCQQELIPLISEYNRISDYEDRSIIVSKMADRVCRCECNKQNQNERGSFYRRLCRGYELIQKTVLEDVK